MDYSKLKSALSEAGFITSKGKEWSASDEATLRDYCYFKHTNIDQVRMAYGTAYPSIISEATGIDMVGDAPVSEELSGDEQSEDQSDEEIDQGTDEGTDLQDVPADEQMEEEAAVVEPVQEDQPVQEPVQEEPAPEMTEEELEAAIAAEEAAAATPTEE